MNYTRDVIELTERYEASLKRIAALEAELAEAKRWRGTDEEPPQNGQMCIVSSTSGEACGYDVWIITSKRNFWESGANWKRWMPFPAGPEEDSE